MENLGYDTVTVDEGSKAVEYFLKNRNRISGMIFDLTIPGGMGGIEAASKIRETDKTVPILVSSGYADDKAMAEPEKFGFSGSITKPFTKEELIKILNRYIKD